MRQTTLRLIGLGITLLAAGCDTCTSMKEVWKRNSAEVGEWRMSTSDGHEHLSQQTTILATVSASGIEPSYALDIESPFEPGQPGLEILLPRDSCERGGSFSLDGATIAASLDGKTWWGAASGGTFEITELTGTLDPDDGPRDGERVVFEGSLDLPATLIESEQGKIEVQAHDLRFRLEMQWSEESSTCTLMDLL
jgi:hypothetical protein